MNHPHFFIIRMQFSFIVLFSAVVCFTALQSSAATRDSTLVVNEYSPGTYIRQYTTLGPFDCMVENSDSTVVRKWLDTNIVHTFACESGEPIRPDYKIPFVNHQGLKSIISAHAHDADDQGWLHLDSIRKPPFGSVTYVQCLIDAAFSFRVRCFWSLGATHRKVWINGTPIHNEWQAAYNGSDTRFQAYFDYDLQPGITPLLFKIVSADSLSTRLTCRLFDIKDSIEPFIKNAGCLSVVFDSSVFYHASTSLVSGMCTFALPVPSYLFKASVMSKNLGNPQSVPYNQTVPIGTRFGLVIPSDYRNSISLDVRAQIGSRQLTKEVFLWRGNLDSCYMNQVQRIREHENRIHTQKNSNTLPKFMIRSIQSWCQSTILAFESLNSQQKIQNLSTIVHSQDIIDSLLKNSSMSSTTVFPFRNTTKLQPALKKDTSQHIPDFSLWLSYRYPEDFESVGSSSDDSSYAGWLLLPAHLKKRKKVPLLVVLYGQDIRGSDIHQFRTSNVLKFFQENTKKKCAVLCLQAPEKKVWNAHLVKSIIDSLVATGNINKNKIYLCGIDMGGFCSYYLATLYPQFFAALIAISTGGEPEYACILKKLPVWIFHGVADTRVPLDMAHSMIRALKSCGNTRLKTTLFPEYGHAIAERCLSNPDLYTWLLHQQR